MNGEIIKKNDIPKGIALSKHLLDKCDEVIVIQFLGVSYYIPITDDINRIIKRRMFGCYTLVENADLFQDIINSVYLQIRDTIGIDIHDQLSRQIEEGFSKLFRLPLAKRIDEQLKIGLPTKNDDNKMS